MLVSTRCTAVYGCHPDKTAESRRGMENLIKSIQTRGVVISAEANFTQDMAENLLSMFTHLEAGQEVTVKFSNKGVWAVTPAGIRLFIGSAEVFEVDSNGRNAAEPQVQ